MLRATSSLHNDPIYIYRIPELSRQFFHWSLITSHCFYGAHRYMNCTPLGIKLSKSWGRMFTIVVFPPASE
jgi:hypothetical protein